MTFVTLIPEVHLSEEVAQAIAERGKFDETEDDVLRRIFYLPSNSTVEESKNPMAVSPVGRLPRQSLATQRMSSNISNNQLQITFQNGLSRSWTLPSKSDKSGIRTVRDKAVSFAKENKATIGQINAVKKTLTENDYHLTK